MHSWMAIIDSHGEWPMSVIVQPQSTKLSGDSNMNLLCDWSSIVYLQQCFTPVNNKRLSKQQWWFETPWRSFWRHCNALANLDCIVGAIILVPCHVYRPWNQVFAAHWSGIRKSLLWRHSGHHGVSNHQPHECLLNRSFRRRSKKTPKLRVTGLCAGNSPETGEFPAQMASDAENVSIWWRHHVKPTGARSANELQWFHFILSDFIWRPGSTLAQIMMACYLSLESLKLT